MSPSAMRAAIFLGPGAMEVRDAPAPVPGADDVLLRVLACGICGSDTRALATPPTMHYTPDIVFGHELVGEVVSGAEPGLAAVFPSIPCGSCEQCLDGRGNLCTRIRHIGATMDGGLAELCVVPRSSLVPLPADADPLLSTLVEPLACVMNGCRRAGLRAGDRVLVLGGGPIGLLFAAMARLSGCTSVTVVEPNERRAAVALAVGADRAIPPAEAEAAAGADVVIDSVGSLTHVALELVAPGGRVVAFGLDWSARSSVTPAAIASRELTIVGAYLGWGTFPAAVRLVAAHGERLRPIASHVFGLEETEAAVGAMARAESVKSIVSIR